MKTPPAEFYIDPLRLRTERERVCAPRDRRPRQPARESGDYFTTRLGNEPLLFTNDGGTIRGFNVAVTAPVRRLAAAKPSAWCAAITAGPTISAVSCCARWKLEGAEVRPAQIRLQSVKVHPSVRSCSPLFDPRRLRSTQCSPAERALRTARPGAHGLVAARFCSESQLEGVRRQLLEGCIPLFIPR
jgi:hypothetical protein